MSLLSRLFERKASSVGNLISLYVLGRPVWQERPFEKLAKEGYQQNVIVYSCVWLIATAASSVPIKIMKGDGKAANKQLRALLDRPNPNVDGVSFVKSIVADFLLGGNAYCERVDVGRQPKELYRWRPDRVRVVPGDQGWPQAFEYTVNGRTKRLPFDPVKRVMPVWQFSDYSPIDDWYGLSPLDPASFSIDSFTGAQRWNRALLENGARPSGALVYAPKDGSDKLSDDTFARLKESLDDSYSGAARAGRPLLLDGGMDWKEMSLTPKEMDWSGGKASSARDIALAIGVPPNLLGIPGDNTYSNYSEANKAFYRQTVLPVLSHLLRGWSWWLCPDFGDGLSLQPDIDDLPVFADERAAQWARIEQSTSMTINEKRAAQGLPPTEGGDVILVSSLMTPLASLGEKVQGSPAPGDDEESADDAADGGKPPRPGKPKPDDGATN